ncbi:phosphate signaling complex PhoU family protein [Amycolatopsis sp. RTGN1]|uniref:phosphate signaling complex PhoU family protein n=1 Tax=Amycolatopsis ponsaeliensis TaxID=2992142 RepID=UPI00254F201B|nr:PhoU domain-containing protein [Amycolatopsis sp. RTGN1]
MRDSYRGDLDRLTGRLFTLSRHAADLIDQATVALEEADGVLAGVVVAEGARFARARSVVEEQAHVILALQAPVASDLRVVPASLHALSELDRMGRLAVHVAEAVQRRHPHPVVPHVLAPRFAEMGRIAVWLAMLAGDAIRTRDVTLARALVAVDAEMDDLHRTLFTTLDYRNWPYGIAAAIDAALLSRYYERFGDHAVSLARQTAFVVTGRPRREDVA